MMMVMMVVMMKLMTMLSMMQCEKYDYNIATTMTIDNHAYVFVTFMMYVI